MTTIKRYMTKIQATQATAKRSLFANERGDCSQFEVRQQGSSFVGGYPGELAELFPTAPIVAQWSGGYRVTDNDR